MHNDNNLTNCETSKLNDKKSFKSLVIKTFCLFASVFNIMNAFVSLMYGLNLSFFIVLAIFLKKYQICAIFISYVFCLVSL